MPPTARAVLPILCALGGATSAEAQNWTRFRGPGGAGLGEARAIRATVTEEDVNWRVELAGRGHSSPVVWGERVFVTGADAAAKERFIQCLRARDGGELWRVGDELEPNEQHELNSFAASTPALDAERVYVAWPSGSSLFALALDHAGERVWSRELCPSSARHGSGASPVLAGDVLVVQNDDEGGASALFGLDRATGETVWKRERETVRASFATPLVLASDTRTEVLFASTAHGITSLDPATGELNWEIAGVFEERCVASPVVAGDLLFACAGQGGGGKESVAIDLAKARERSADAVRYRLQRALPYVPTPIAADGLLFLWADGGVVSCLDARDGRERWRERVDGSFFGSPVCVDGRLYAMSRSGELVVVAAGPEFELLSRFDLGEPTEATPAVAGGALFLRTERHLTSIGGGSGDPRD